MISSAKPVWITVRPHGVCTHSQWPGTLCSLLWMEGTGLLNLVFVKNKTQRRFYYTASPAWQLWFGQFAQMQKTAGSASTDVLILSGGSRELTALLAWASGNVWRSHKSSDLFFFCQVHFDFPVCSHPPLPDFTDLFPPLTQDYTYLLPGIVTQNTLCLFNQHSWFSSGKDGGQGEGLGEGEVNYEPWTALVTSFLSRPLGKSDASCRNRGI